MNNGIDLNDLPGAQGRRNAPNGNLVKPDREGIDRIVDVAPIRNHQPAIQYSDFRPGWNHQPAIRVIPNVPADWIRPNRNKLLDAPLSFFGTFGTLLKGLILLLLVGGLVLGTGTLLLNFGEQLLDWLAQAGGAVLSGLQYLAQGAIALFLGAIDLVLAGLLFVLGAVVETAVWCVEYVVDDITNACVWLIDSIITIIVFVVDFWHGGSLPTKLLCLFVLLLLCDSSG